MTQTDPGFEGDPAQTSAMKAPDTSDPIWAQQIATIAGLMTGRDRYAPMTPPPIGGMLDAQSLGERTTANAQQRQMEDQIKWQNAQRQGAQPAATGAAGSGDWRADVLTRIGAPVSPENLRALDAWQRAEGGGTDGPSHSDFNWLNTTRNAPDAPVARVINSVGVKAYRDYQAGINATVGALMNGHYGNIIAALQAGTDAMQVAAAIEHSVWGTGGGVLRILQGDRGTTHAGTQRIQ